MIPEVAFVELPPKKPVGEKRKQWFCRVVGDSDGEMKLLTLLVQNDHIATGEVDGVRSTETGHCEFVVSSSAFM